MRWLLPYTWLPLRACYDKVLAALVKSGVHPDKIFLEDRSMAHRTFRKVMRDPLLIQAGVERMIDFVVF